MSYSGIYDFLKEKKNLEEEKKTLEEENKKLREFKERAEEECGASAVMTALMDRIQELEEENKGIKDRNNKQQVVIVNETIEKEKAQIEKEKALVSWKEEAEALAEEVAEQQTQLDLWESGEVTEIDNIRDLLYDKEKFEGKDISWEEIAQLVKYKENRRMTEARYYSDRPHLLESSDEE